jgi:hypothetical protein
MPHRPVSSYLSNYDLNNQPLDPREAAQLIVGAATPFRLRAAFALKGYPVVSVVWLNFSVGLLFDPMTPPLLQDVLPELAEEMRTLLEKDSELDLASQISSLRIVDRCRCGDDFCATFYTVPKPRGAWGPAHETIVLDCEDGYLNVDIVNRKIVSVEVLYRDALRDKLHLALP